VAEAVSEPPGYLGNGACGECPNSGCLVVDWELSGGGDQALPPGDGRSLPVCGRPWEKGGHQAVQRQAGFLGVRGLWGRPCCGPPDRQDRQWPPGSNPRPARRRVPPCKPNSIEAGDLFRRRLLPRFDRARLVHQPRDVLLPILARVTANDAFPGQQAIESPIEPMPRPSDRVKSPTAIPKASWRSVLRRPNAIRDPSAARLPIRPSRPSLHVTPPVWCQPFPYVEGDW